MKNLLFFSITLLLAFSVSTATNRFMAAQDPVPSGDERTVRPQRDQFADFDIRADVERSLERADRIAVRRERSVSFDGRGARLFRERPGTTVRWSSLSQGPSRLSNIARGLSEPSAGRPDLIARGFLRENRDLFRLDDSEISGLVIAGYDRTAHNGLTHVRFQQRIDGIDIFQGEYAIHVSGTGAVISADGELFAGTAQPSGGAKIAAEEAVRIGAGKVGRDLRGTLAPVGAAAGRQQKQRFRASAGTFAEDPEIRLVYFPLAGGTLRRAWEMTLRMNDSPDAWLLLIDAETGSLLYRYNLTWYCFDDHSAPAAYGPARAFETTVATMIQGQSNSPHGPVFTRESPRPNLPVTSNSPPVVDRVDVPFVPTQFLGATIYPQSDPHYDWWNGQPKTGLTSNNTDTYLDRNADNTPDSPRLTAADGNFTYPLDLSLAPTTQDNQNAAQVNLFYWVNRYHDILYHFGFTESAGNFQSNNFNLGGLGNDPIRAEAQDGSGTNNANYSGSRDGTTARIQMYLWSGSPQLDGDLDQGIIIHELTHGLSTRLVGNGTGLTGLQGRGMGEGWSDYFGLALLREESDDLKGNYAVGQYAVSNFTRGIRRYPYSTNKQVYPLNYGDISINTAVHPVGEIWCNTLLEMRAELIGGSGWQEGHRQSIQLVVDGLKLAPTAPSFLDARDAILLADKVNNNGSNQCSIWKAFSKHGMGYSASTLGTNDGNPIESFDMPAFCSDLGIVSLGRKIYLNGETVDIAVGDRNATGPIKVEVRSSATNDVEMLTLTPDALYASNYLAGIQLTSGPAIPGDGKLQGSFRLQDRILVRYIDANNGAGTSVQVTAEAAAGGENSIFDDDVESGNRGWSATGTPVNSWAITEQKSSSGKRSWTDSPAGNYADRQDTSLVSPLLDLSNADGVTLQFTHSFAFESGFDYGLVEFSTDDGDNWTRIAAFNGIQASFVRDSVRIDALNGRSRARIRFRIKSDENLNFDGWHIDDIRVIVRSGDGSIVPPPDALAPVILSLSPAFGPPEGGTSVTISGINFTEESDQKVFFDGQAGTGLQIVNSSTVRVKTPAHGAGTVGVTVTTRNGTANLFPAFTYHINGSQAPTPQILSLYPTTGSRSGGTIVTVNGNGFTPETTVRFGAQTAAVTFISPFLIAATAPATGSTGPVNLTVSNGTGLEAALNGGFTYVDPTPPSGQLRTLNGGEILFAGSTRTILWNASDNRAIVKQKLALKKNGAAGTTAIAEFLEGSARSFNWNIPANIEQSDQYRIQLTVTDDEGAQTVVESASDITIGKRWMSQIDSTLSVQRPAGGTDGKYIYIFGGRATGNSSTTISTVQRYDPATKTWSTSDVAPMITGLNAAKAAYHNGKFYIPGGINQQVQISSSHQEYDVATNTWRALSPAPSILFLYGLSVDQSSGLIYKTGGIEGTLAVSDFHVYNIATGQWTVLPSMPTARFAHDSVIHNGKIYVAAGNGTTGGLLSAEAFDIAAGKWSSLAPHSIARQYHTSAVAQGADGRSYWLLIGGEDPSTGAPLRKIEAYDFAADKWIVLDGSFDLPTARTRLTSAVLDGSVYAMSGAIPATSGTINSDLVESMSLTQIAPGSPDQPPVLTVPAGEQIAVAGIPLAFGVAAQDLGSSIPVTVTATGLPDGANFNYANLTNNSGLGTVNWTPGGADTGRAWVVNFTATDGNLTETKSVVLRVVSAGTSTAVNAADFRFGPLASNSIAALFGTDLAVRTESARSNPLPFSVAGTEATINGLPVPLFFVSPNQINFAVPQLLANGPATMIVKSPAGMYSVAQLTIASAAPALFTANASGRGDAVAQATTDGISYQQQPFDVTVNGSPNVLVLYGTGIRNAQASDPFDSNGVAESVQVTIGGVPATVLYAGAQGSFSGLDQINLIIPPALAGGSERSVEIRLSVNGVEANAVTIVIR
ncbi:MAG: M36 family metallopeptidase [Blastocatellales bacterium]